MARIALNGVRKVYPNGVEAVKGVSFTVEDGAMAVIVGPSGCGKSTLLRMVAGLETISEGEVSIGERVVNRLEPADRDIAMVFQNYALYPHMSVYDNLAYGLRNRGVARAEIDARVTRAATMLDIEPLLARKPRQLSGGQRQRVAMGRALVREPAAFLFDEPLSNLDAKLRVHMRVEIRKLQRSLKVTSLYVTHDQVEAMTLADMLVVMNGGGVEQIGAPFEVYSRPATRFVAEFIGSPAMNLLEARVADDDWVLIEGGVRAPAQGARANGAPAGEGRPVLFGVRPEHLAPAEGQPGHLELAVEATEILGADTLAYGVLSGADGHPHKLVARLPGGSRVAEGDLIPLRLDPSKAHLFDAESGARL